jgi:predicted nucleic acid-binding protein
MVVFDTTVLSLLLRPGSRAPLNITTGAPVVYARERLETLVESLQKTRTAVLIPAPVLTELLIKAGAAGPGIIAAIQRSTAFRVAPFDTRAAIELAQITNASLLTARARREAEAATAAKIKFDRQIVAIAKVNNVTAIYSDDGDLIAFAAIAGIKGVRTADLPVPESARQGRLALDQPPDETKT